MLQSNIEWVFRPGQVPRNKSVLLWEVRGESCGIPHLKIEMWGGYRGKNRCLARGNRVGHPSIAKGIEPKACSFQAYL
jgi:hypothetical protein